jgi:hypothetical protein
VLSEDVGTKLHDLALRSAREGQTRLRQLEARLKKLEQDKKPRRAKPARRAK